jgi:hypothetical protein
MFWEDLSEPTVCTVSYLSVRQPYYIERLRSVSYSLRDLIISD